MAREVKQVTFTKAAIPMLTRVAAYARVSSAKNAMHHSLSAQVSYYSGLIQNHPGWQYVWVYADKAKTGTKDTREAFVRLVSDCKAGKVDMVITKSISRFARNTVTLLETVRDLKVLGIDVFFEEQNIHTLSADGELMLSILAPTHRKRAFRPAKIRNGVCVRISRSASRGTGRSSATATGTASTSLSRTRPKRSSAFSGSSFPARGSSPSPMA